MTKFTLKSLPAAVLASSLTVLLCQRAWGEIKQADQPFYDPVEYSMDPDASLNPPVESSAAIVHRTLAYPQGKIMDYTATTGHLATKSHTGGREASVFYTAYTSNGNTNEKRPVTFFFNGSDGTPAIYLHMTSWAPTRMNENTGTEQKPNYPVLPSKDSLLDKTDMVFIDPPGRGYSQAIAPAKNKDFRLREQDAEIFRDFIAQYLKENHRENSPVYLFGESEGGARASILVNKLNDIGLPVSGVILVSPVTGFDMLDGKCNNYAGRKPTTCSAVIPSLAATSYYYGIAGQGETLQNFITKVNDFIEKEYIPAENTALENNTSLPTSIIEKLVKFTGFEKSLWSEFPVNIGDRFADPTQLYIEAANLTCDLSIWPRQQGCPGMTDDKRKTSDLPQLPLDTAAFAENFFKNHLGYESVVRYNCHETAEDCIKKNETLLLARNNDDAFYDTVSYWARALKENSSLRLLTINGYHDFIINFRSTQRTLRQDARLAAYQDRIDTTVFSGGHAVHETAESRPAIRDRLVSFYEKATDKRNWLEDSNFLQYKKLPGLKSTKVSGIFGAWLTDNSVSLVSSGLVETNNKSQAISLNALGDTNYSPGVPGSFYQDIFPPEKPSSKKWELSFKAGNSYQNWCTSARNGYTGKRYTGEQRFQVSIHMGDELITKKDFSLGYSDSSQPSLGWMSPKWQHLSVPFTLPLAQKSPPVRITFTSLSEPDKACGNLITQTVLRPINGS